jgi:DNA replication and repair protein RecF
LILDELVLSQFRNYQQEEVKFSPRVNIFYGQNAQGKTNLIEAVYYIGLGRSFRTRKDEEIIRQNNDSFFIRGLFRQGEEDLLVELGCSAKEFRGKINGDPIKRKSDIFGRVNIVLFAPDDLQIIKGGPQSRREYLDLYLSQAYPKYRWILYQYYKVLQQRNSLLKQIKEGKASSQLLEAWDESYLQRGVELIKLRMQALSLLNPIAGKYHCEISGCQEALMIHYQSFSDQRLNDESDIEGLFRERMNRRRFEEMARGISLVGPHRDDLVLTIGNGMELRTYGSQGQQRTAALALKMSMVDLIGEVTGNTPILLLDDVLSEFDDTRKRSLLAMLTRSTQTLVTTADFSSSKLFDISVQLFHVEDGRIVAG